MSTRLESLLDPQRRAQCVANDAQMECCTHRCYEGQDCPQRYGFPTSRRHPRTLADAFPDERARFLEPHQPLPLVRRIALFFRRHFA